MQRSIRTSNKAICFLFFAFVTAFFSPAFGQDAAGDLRQQAKAENKPVLIFYHGSDWRFSG